MHQYLFTHLNQKYGLKVNIHLWRISPSKQLIASSQPSKSILLKRTILQSSARSSETKLMKSSGMSKPNSNQLSTIYWKCISKVNIPTKAPLKSMRSTTRKSTIKFLLKSVKILSNTYTIRMTHRKFYKWST